MNPDILNRIVEIDKERRSLGERDKELADERSRLEQQLLDDFQQNGIQSIRANGATVYLERKLWARPNAPRDKVAAALRDAGLDEYVKEDFNTNSISAYARELDETGEELPPELQEVLTVNEVFKVKTRRT